MKERDCVLLPPTSALSDAGGARELLCHDRTGKKYVHTLLFYTGNFHALTKTHPFRMVVANSETSTSALKRKNRRSLNKKKSAAVSEPTVQKTGVEAVVDQEMEPIDQEVFDPEIQPTASTTDTEVGRDEPGDVGDDDEVMIDTDPSAAGLPPSSAPSFPALTGSALQTSLKSEMRRVSIPPHRMSPLKKDWINIFGPLTEILGLQVRMNIPRKAVEIRVSSLLSVFYSTPSSYPYFCFSPLDLKTHERDWVAPERCRLCQSLRTWV
jgi:hypothetical protein